MAAKSTLVNMAACLTAVCLVCAGILGGVYAMTAEPIKAAAEKALKASIAQVLPEGGEISEMKTVDVEGSLFEYYENVADGAVTAYAVKSTTIGFGGPLVLMVGILPDGTICNTSVLSHSETPGLGAKCTDDQKFMGQWKGLSPDKNLAVVKDGGDIDAITASTITSRAYTLAVANAKNAVKVICGAEADAVSGASTTNAEEETVNE